MHDSELSVVLEGDSDSLAIRAYLAIEQKPEDIAKLAAIMAPRQEVFDPKDLVDAAVSLQTEAEAGLVRTRETLVEPMNYRTLLTLARELNVLEPGEQQKQLQDPVAGPVIRRMHVIQNASTEITRARNDAQISKALAAADNRTQTDRPQLPCDLEVALRYAVDAESQPWELLKGAFVDFLGVFESEAKAEIEAENEEALTADIDHVTRVLAALEMKPQDSPGRDDSLREHEGKLENLKSALSSIECIKAYRLSFTPGTVAPEDLAQEASATFARYWSTPKGVRESNLAWLCTEFHQFWQEHGAAYVDRHERALRRAEVTRQKKSAAGRRGSEKRLRRTWMERTDAFINFVQEDGGMPSPRAIPELIESFVHQGLDLKHSDTRRKARDFFGALCIKLNNEFDESGIMQILEPCGLGKIDEDTVRKCHAALREAFGKGPSKKSKKPKERP
jgi:hypothetical protein